MLVDLTVRGKRALVLGDGEPARVRRDMLTHEGARVTVVRVPSEKRGERARRGGARAMGAVPGLSRLMREKRPVLVFSTLKSFEQNRAIARIAHSFGALVHVYDVPPLSDFTLPSTGTAGPIRFAVSTSGQSPAMAVLLRRRLERAIRPTDVAQVRLQGRLRRTIQRSIPTMEARREVIYELVSHREIARLLRANRAEEAMTVARRVIASRVPRSVPAARTRR